MVSNNKDNTPNNNKNNDPDNSGLNVNNTGLTDKDMDTTFDNVDMSDKKMIFIIFMIGLVIGCSLGFFIFYDTYVKATDEQVKYIEDRMKRWPQGEASWLRGQNTIQDVVTMYFQYGQVAQYLLRAEIENLCGAIQWNTQPILNQTKQNSYTQCFDTCTSSIEVKVSSEGLLPGLPSSE